MRTILFSLLVLSAVPTWADIPKNFFGGYTGFDPKSARLGIPFAKSNLVMQLNADGLAIVSAEDSAGRRWRFHYPMSWLSESSKEVGLTCYKVSERDWDEPLFTLCFDTFLIRGHLPELTLGTGRPFDFPKAQLFKNNRFDEPKLHKLIDLYSNLSRVSLKPNPLDVGKTAAQFEFGSVTDKEQVVRLASHGLSYREGADLTYALTVLHLALDSNQEPLQLAALSGLKAAPQTAPAVEWLENLLKNSANLSSTVMTSAIETSAVILAEARADLEAPLYLQNHYGTQNLDEIFAKKLGVIDVGMQPHIERMLNSSDRHWEKGSRLRLLSMLRNLSHDPSTKSEIQGIAGRVYMRDLSLSHPTVAQFCMSLMQAADMRFAR